MGDASDIWVTGKEERDPSMRIVKARIGEK